MCLVRCLVRRDEFSGCPAFRGSAGAGQGASLRLCYLVRTLVQPCAALCSLVHREQYNLQFEVIWRGITPRPDRKLQVGSDGILMKVKSGREKMIKCKPRSISFTHVPQMQPQSRTLVRGISHKSRHSAIRVRVNYIVHVLI